MTNGWPTPGAEANLLEIERLANESNSITDRERDDVLRLVAECRTHPPECDSNTNPHCYQDYSLSQHEGYVAAARQAAEDEEWSTVIDQLEHGGSGGG